MLPLESSARLSTELIRRGWRPGGPDAVFYAAPRGCLETPPTTDGISVRLVAPADLPSFATRLARAWDPPEESVAAKARDLVGQDSSADWRCFIAELDGAPVGAAALFRRSRGAFLELSATLPAARRRGVQAALLRARLEAARDCLLVASTPYPFSSSQRNVERAGLRLAYHKSLWTQGAPHDG